MCWKARCSRAATQVRVNAQLIDADSGAHLWAEQFDTPRADLLQTQDEIVTHLARAMSLQLPEAEAARLKRTPAANPDAEDLALQCQAAERKPDSSARKRMRVTLSANRRSRIDPNNVHALCFLAMKFINAVSMGTADPRPTSSGRTNWRRRPSPSIRIAAGSCRKGLGSLQPGAPRAKPLRSTNGRSPWTRPRRTPCRRWAGITLPRAI